MKNKRYIYIKPKARKSAQGRHLLTHNQGKDLTKTKAPGASFTLQILGRNGILNSGLDRFIDNPYKGSEEIPPAWQSFKIEEKERITKQQEMEIKYGFEPGTLTSVMQKDPKKYTKLQTWKFRLEDAENRIPLDNFDGEMLYEYSKVSSLIANDYQDAVLSPYARFYVSDINEEEGQKAAQNKIKLQANANLNSLFTENAASTQEKFAIILGLVKGEVSNDIVQTKLFDFVNSDKKSSINMSKFLDLWDMFKDKNTKKRFETLFFLKNLINYAVIHNDRGTHYWMSQKGTPLYIIGKMESVALQWLMDKGNEEYVNMLKQELKNKKNVN